MPDCARFEVWAGKPGRILLRVDTVEQAKAVVLYLRGSPHFKLAWYVDRDAGDGSDLALTPPR